MVLNFRSFNNVQKAQFFFIFGRIEKKNRENRRERKRENHLRLEKFNSTNSETENRSVGEEQVVSLNVSTILSNVRSMDRRIPNLPSLSVFLCY